MHRPTCTKSYYDIDDIHRVLVMPDSLWKTTTAGTSFIFLILQVAWILLIHTESIYCKVFTFGLLFPWQGFVPVGSHSAGAVTIALEEIQNDTTTFALLHSGGHRINFTWADTECEESVGLPLITDMYFGIHYEPVDAFIGPGCSVICEPGGHLITDWAIPMISWGSTSSAMSDKILYPTFARTIAPNWRSANFFVKTLLNFDYERVAIFYSSDNVWSLTAVYLKAEFESAGIEVAVYVMFQAGENGKENEKEELRIAAEKTRGMYSLHFPSNNLREILAGSIISED